MTNFTDSSIRLRIATVRCLEIGSSESPLGVGRNRETRHAERTLGDLGHGHGLPLAPGHL